MILIYRIYLNKIYDGVIPISWFMSPIKSPSVGKMPN